MLSVNSVTKQFNDHVVLNELNLNVHEGSIFGLVGVNGSGKSTLLRCICGVYDCEDGNVEFDGIDTHEDKEIRKDIFYVSDDPYFPFASNIKSLVEWYSSFYNFDTEMYKKTMDLFKLEDNKPISSFSKGMKRQTMLVIALSIKPKLLLLDEAFDGLDPIVRYNLKKILVDFIVDNKSTIIISSHNLKELEDICDSYGILDNGKIETYGDLLESKENINKYQLAFDHDIDESVFEQFDVLHQSKQGSVYSLVIKGNNEETMNKLRELNPIILDSLQVNFEELFIYEYEGGKKNA